MVLKFSRGLVAMLAGLPPQPDAIKKVAEATKAQLLRACHPDRHAGGTQRSQEISEAYESIKRPGPDRDALIKEFLERKDNDLREHITQVSAELRTLRTSLDRESGERRRIQASSEQREKELTTALRDFYWDTALRDFDYQPVFPDIPRGAISLLSPPQIYLVELDDERKGWLLLCQERRIIRQLDYHDGDRRALSKSRARDTILRSTRNLDLLKMAKRKYPVIVGSMGGKKHRTDQDVITSDIPSIIAGVRYYIIPQGQLVSVKLRSQSYRGGEVNFHYPDITRIEVVKP